MAYSGTLKSHFTTPTFTKPVDTFKDVVESGLPWTMIDYGGEKCIANDDYSKDLCTQELFERKIMGNSF